MAVRIRCADHATVNLQKLALTSLTSGGHSVGIVNSRTKGTEFFYIYYLPQFIDGTHISDLRTEGCKPLV
jgi:hypothetical protein